MNEIFHQVARARRRLILQQFLGIVVWAMFTVLCVAAVGLAVPKIWVIEVDAAVWASCWIGGAVGAGLLLAIAWTYCVRSSRILAAIEIDRRFGLKERVSSALSLGPAELTSEAGIALVSDAERRVAELEIGEQFRVRSSWRALLPLLPGVLVFALLVLPNATRENKTEAAQANVEIKKQIEKTTDELKKKIEEERKKAAAKGLKDAEMLFKQLQDNLDKMKDKEKGDRQQAMIKLNNLKEEIDKRRQALGDTEKMKDQLNQLKNIDRGPADKVASALKEGNFNKAMDELKRLEEKLKKGDLTPEEQEKLADQMKQMQDKMQQMVDAHEDAKRELQKKIDEANKAGRREEAGKMQQQLDKLNRMNDKMDRLKQMSDKLGQCGKCLKEGNANQAADQLGQISDQLKEMQKDLDELETLDEAMNQIAGAKNKMNCDKCGGKGCEHCQGGDFGMDGDGQGDQDGPGLGEGQARGDRPEEKTDTGVYESQVRAKLRPGEAVRTGDADGINLPGTSKEAVKEHVLSSLNKDSDPLTNERLPRAQRQHAKQYFDRFRKGE